MCVILTSRPSSQYEPPDKELVKKGYDRFSPVYNELVEEVKYILNKGIKTRKIRISEIETRVKEFESFYKKIIRHKITKDPFEAIEDIAGVRVICLYRSDLAAMEKLIRSKFKVIKAEIIHDKRDGVFGYMSDHYVVKLAEHFSGERYDSIKFLKCEIQVRTVSMHAWATVSHHLDYKQEIDIPSHLKNDFYALSGVFYIADSLFEQFRDARERSINVLAESVEKNRFDLKQEMNLDSIQAFLAWKFPERKFEADDDPTPTLEDYSYLIGELRERGLCDYQKLNKLLNDSRDYISGNDPELFYTRTGIVRAMLYEFFGAKT